MKDIFFKNTQSKENLKQKGFAMLFAVLASSVLLSVGLSIFNLTVKELLLSSSGRESQFAFYAADTGVECALYWDFKGTNIFATSSGSASRNPSTTSPDCVDTAGLQTFDVMNPSPVTISSATTQFSLAIPNTIIVNGSSVDASYCVIVSVAKSLNGSIIETSIDSRGYNTRCDSTDPNRVERAIRVNY